MSFKPSLLIFITCNWLAIMPKASCATEMTATAVQLKLTPDTCVALQQGRPCYATIQVQWRNQQPLPLCLYAGTEKLQCWAEGTSGQWRYEFVASDSQRLQLKHAEIVLAESMIKVNWVQKNPKVKRHWRLF